MGQIDSIVNTHQYQKVVRGLKAALLEPIPDAALAVLLDEYPSAAEIHESLNYETNGLSRTSIETNVSSEVLALQALQRASIRRC